MNKLSILALASLSTVVVAGCAASTTPEGSPSDTDSEARTETAVSSPKAESVTPIPLPIHFCLAPITPMPGEWSCGSSGVRTGDKYLVTSSGYTNNCAGRVTVEYSVPQCSGDPDQLDEIHIGTVGLTASTASACAASYLDYTIVETSGTTIVNGPSGRVYGTFYNDTCFVEAPVYQPLASAYTSFTISADAYEPNVIYFDGTPIFWGSSPVNVSIDASFL